MLIYSVMAFYLEYLSLIEKKRWRKMTSTTIRYKIARHVNDKYHDNYSIIQGQTYHKTYNKSPVVFILWLK